MTPAEAMLSPEEQSQGIRIGDTNRFCQQPSANGDNESGLGSTQTPSGEPAPGPKTRLGHMSRAHPGDRAGDKLPAIFLQAPSRRNKSESWENKGQG